MAVTYVQLTRQAAEITRRIAAVRALEDAYASASLGVRVSGLSAPIGMCTDIITADTTAMVGAFREQVREYLATTGVDDLMAELLPTLQGTPDIKPTPEALQRQPAKRSHHASIWRTAEDVARGKRKRPRKQSTPP